MFQFFTRMCDNFPSSPSPVLIGKPSTVPSFPFSGHHPSSLPKLFSQLPHELLEWSASDPLLPISKVLVLWLQLMKQFCGTGWLWHRAVFQTHSDWMFLARKRLLEISGHLLYGHRSAVLINVGLRIQMIFLGQSIPHILRWGGCLQMDGVVDQAAVGQLEIMILRGTGKWWVGALSECIIYMPLYPI